MVDINQVKELLGAQKNDLTNEPAIQMWAHEVAKRLGCSITEADTAVRDMAQEVTGQRAFPDTMER